MMSDSGGREVDRPRPPSSPHPPASTVQSLISIRELNDFPGITSVALPFVSLPDIYLPSVYLPHVFLLY